jgi:hypothetical protein
MTEKSNILSELASSTEKLTETISRFPSAKLHDKANPETWSAAEVVEHIVALETLVNEILMGATEVATDNPQKDMTELIKNIFGDFDRKLKAFGQINPKDNSKDKADLIYMFQKSRQTLTEIINNNDLSRRCTGFTHHAFGNLTRLEWIYLLIYHTERHIQQIERM